MKSLITQIKILAGVILANFLVQIPYNAHLYWGRYDFLTGLRIALPLLIVFAMFAVGYIGLTRKSKVGYLVLIVFLAMEFGFYLLNEVGAIVHGYGPLFHLAETDPILWLAFFIGYLNLIASGYFLILLITNYRKLIAKS